MAEDVTTVLAFRKMAIMLTGCLQGFAVASDFQETDFSTLALKTGIIYLPVRPDGRHQKGVTGKGAKVLDPS
jgi:hypothetical protein